MGREIRRVSPRWEHPRDYMGHLKPLLDRDYEHACQAWLEGLVAWESGEDPQRAAATARWYWDWDGPPPDKDTYRPTWDAEPTWYQMYETVTEGTPVTPPFETPAELVEYLVQHGEDCGPTGHGEPWRREAAEAFVNHGWAPTAIIAGGRLYRPSDQDLVAERAD